MIAPNQSNQKQTKPKERKKERKKEREESSGRRRRRRRVSKTLAFQNRGDGPLQCKDNIKCLRYTQGQHGGDEELNECQIMFRMDRSHGFCRLRWCRSPEQRTYK
jgi:hypothetical protein